MLSEQRKVDNAMPSRERQTLFTVPEIRSLQAGGSNTRRYRGTEAEQQAFEADKGREKGKSRDRDRGKGGKTQTKGKQLYEHMPRGTYNV